MTATTQVRPNFGAVLGSKRLRLAAAVAAAIVTVLLLIHVYEPPLPSLSDYSSWTPSALRPGGGSSSPSTLPSTTTPSADLKPADSPPATGVDWSKYAYVQYATNSLYLCNSVMIFETLHRLGAKADRLLMYPSTMLPDPKSTAATSDDARLVIKARDEYGAKLAPIDIQHRAVADSTWAESFTKLLAFNQTQYTRVLHLDSDGTVLQPMDELFLLPSCPVAMPRAYWLYPEKKILSSQIMLVEPSRVEFDRVMDKINHAGSSDYDMEIVNDLYMDSALILPHRKYDLLTAEFSGRDHKWYLGSDREAWDPVAAFNEGKFLHFSDWPMPKPWLDAGEATRQRKEPPCVDKGGKQDCTEREMWNGFYKDFKERRDRVCRSNSKRRRAHFEAPLPQ